MTNTRAMAIAVAVSALLGVNALADQIGAKKQSPKTAYASSQGWPDWSGVWDATDRSAIYTIAQTGAPPPLKPKYLAEFMERRLLKAAAKKAGKPSPFPVDFCHPQIFSGNMATSDSYVMEFLYSSERITIITETGLVRRIYVDGRTLPDDPIPSFTGTSVGHWEGKVLVVETVGLSEDARIGGEGDLQLDGTLQTLGTPLGKTAKTLERMFLTPQGQLQIDTTTIAPDILVEPYKKTQLWKRVNMELVPYTFCPINDRNIDKKTGFYHFDATPPPDLPPPPSQ
jgi:hypothetical protein